jgi:competence protein ComEA
MGTDQVWVTAETTSPGNNRLKERKEIQTMRKFLNFLLVAVVVLGIAGSAMAADTAAAAPSGVVNLNTADAVQLSLLPRVGVKAAQRIIDYRHEHGLFKKTSDLMQVKGFGDKKYQSLAAYLTVEGKTTLTQKVKSPRKPRAPKASTSHPTSR